MRSVESEVWSLKFGVRRVLCEVWSVEGRTRSGQGLFDFRKLPPPACPGLC